MDVVLLSRLQFAAATYFHFLFVPLTLGMAVLIAIMETLYVKRGDAEYKRMAKFWGKLFLINFAVGIVTGITLEFQFGTNWSRYSEYVGDVFGSLLAIEASATFFLESTFIAVWALGWNKLSAKAHCAAAWLVAIGSNLSAVWILTANAWMQNPVGYEIRNGRAELTDFWAILMNPTAHLAIVHTLSAAYILAAFFIMSISAYHLLKKQNVEFFRRCFAIAATFGLIFSIVVVAEGHLHGSDIAKHQPAKLAAMETHWETSTNAPIYLFALPDEFEARNRIEFLPIPGALSMLAFHRPDAEVTGLADIPADERPPVLITFAAFRLMVGLGMLFIAIMAIGWWFRKRIDQQRWSNLYLKGVLYAIPLPYIAISAGWTVTEVGRQPWIVYNVMRTSDGASPIEPTQVLITLIAFILVYGLLGVAGFWLMVRAAKEGPGEIEATADVVAPDPALEAGEAEAGPDE